MKKRHIAYIEGQGFEWLEDPKHLAAIITNRSKVGAKPQNSQGGKDLGKSDPEALDELEEVEGKLFQQDTGSSIFVSRCENDDEATKAGQSLTGQAGEISRGHAEAHASDSIIKSTATL